MASTSGVGSKIQTFESEITPKEGGLYTYKCSFKDESGKELYQREFTLVKEYKGEGTVYDVLSLNSSVNEKVHKVVGNSPKELEKVLNEFKVGEELKKPQTRSILVVDIKGNTEGYKGLDKICKCEKKLIEALKQDADSISQANTKELAKLIQTHKIEHIFLEGSLKHHVLELFESNKEIQEFLNENNIQFCRLVEPFITSAKLGDRVIGPDGQEFDLSRFIKPLSNDKTAYRPANQTTVFYPPIYKTTYCEGSAFHKQIGKIHSVAFKALAEDWNQMTLGGK